MGYSGITKYAIRNAFAVAGFIVIIYILYMFCSGSALHERIQGHWVSVENFDEYTFMNNEYVHGTDSGVYRIHGNKIFFSSGAEYFIGVKNEWLVINGVYYWKK